MHLLHLAMDQLGHYLETHDEARLISTRLKLVQDASKLVLNVFKNVLTCLERQPFAFVSTAIAHYQFCAEVIQNAVDHNVFLLFVS